MHDFAPKAPTLSTITFHVDLNDFIGQRSRWILGWVLSNAAKRVRTSELYERHLLFPGQPSNFIDRLVPCSTTPPDDTDSLGLENAFRSYRPEPGHEEREYPTLLAGFRKVVEPLEEDRKLEFADIHGVEMPFPFNAFNGEHRLAHSDIAVSFPGQCIVPGSWRHISMVVKFNADEAQDPFPRGTSDIEDDRAVQGVRTVEQLAKSARNLLLVHGFLYAYLVGIYGDNVRLMRFDHSCALVSSSFSLKDGGAKVLRKFFWHLAHPIVGNTVAGADPTVIPLDKESQDWVKSELSRAKPRNWEHHVAALEEGRRVEVYDEKTGRCFPYLLYHLIDVDGRLFSRATMVWRAIEDTRIRENGCLVPDRTCMAPVKPRILKEAWRRVDRTAETEVYKRLQERIPEEERFGLAKMECGGDIGAFEMEWWERRTRDGPLQTTSETTGTSRRGEGESPSTIRAAAAHAVLFCSTGSNGPDAVPFLSSSPGRIPDKPFPLPYPQHQTYSWSFCDEKYWHHERSHVRMVIDDIGRPLTEFTSTREMVMAMRDAIKGHQQAMERAGVLHRDISVGNILIVDDTMERAYTGFLHDFDCSFMADKNDSGAECNGEDTSNDGPAAEVAEPELPEEPTGTFYFLAWDLLRTKQITAHNFRHDLESFYWVLCWVILRHTVCHSKYSRWDGRSLCEVFFKPDNTNGLASAVKCKWFSTQNYLEIHGNVPLTTLVDKFTDMVAASYPPVAFRHFKEELTYEGVLKAFDEVLEMDGWPQDDGTICAYKFEERDGVSNAPVVAPVTADLFHDHQTETLLATRSSQSPPTQGASVISTGGSASSSAASSSPEPSTLAILEAGPLTRSALKHANDADQLSPMEESQRPSKHCKSATQTELREAEGANSPVRGPPTLAV
ncbi:hypothetical protein C8Q70DRAFT_1056640 [Cubamyces menziesii]|uniref:Fungal-type protein kinase domain-containing protein n=1 Tax=Trametes cubensis TaxID=1111947 RepID=A0AAD7TZT5_9APHY|nr:hypothetical protein C8Q70DRAFT_1056640 [Cubamyces menziesii]KAJ8488343.1 hypothetical protein ONZ51_g3608 [Trametes cubensis]